MKKFLAIYYAPAENFAAFAALTPEQKMEGMKPWMAWQEKSGKGIADMGAPLMPANSIDDSGNWSGSSKEVTGYSIVQAENTEAAKLLFDGHPHLKSGPGTSVEIHEFAEM